MLKDIIEVYYVKEHKLLLRFEDGVQGSVDVAALVTFTGVFAPLRDERYFAQVQINPESGTICWPNGADLDPDILYATITGEPITLAEPMLAFA